MLTAREEQEGEKDVSSLAVVDDPFEPQPTPEEALRDDLIENLEDLGRLAWKPMFEGFGIYSGRGMFCLVDKFGRPAFRVSELSEVKYRNADAEQVGRLQFWTIPQEVLDDETLLIEWATESLGVSLDSNKRAFKF